MSTCPPFMVTAAWLGSIGTNSVIAIAIANNPAILLADEPTTALDVTIQSQIIQLIRRIRADFGMSMILITHDLGLVAGIADRILVMYAGRVVEEGSTEQIFYGPSIPTRWGFSAQCRTLRTTTRRSAPSKAPHRC